MRRRGRARGGGEWRERRGDWGGRKIFFAGFPVPHSPFPVPRSPIEMGTGPAIANKIKGLRGFWEPRAGAEERLFTGAARIFCGIFGIVSLLEVNGLRQFDGDFSIKLTSPR